MITLILIHERSTERGEVYSVDPQGVVLRDTVYLSNIAMRQQFMGDVPKRLTMTLAPVSEAS